MSNLGYRTVYRYFCVEENKYITEERVENSIPTNCSTDVTHTIKPGSISTSGKFTRVKQINQNDLFDDCDLTSIDLLNVHQKCEQLAQRVRVLENILQKNGNIKFN
jgi:hypothetical protein